MYRYLSGFKRLLNQVTLLQGILCGRSSVAVDEMVKRAAWLTIGIVSLALGALGVILPLLPTTPFILVAAFAFAQSSDRLHRWLVDHNLFSPLISNWRRYGAISRSAKFMSVVSMGAILLISFAMRAPAVVIIVQALVLGACAVFIVSRPLPPGEHRD